MALWLPAPRVGCTAILGAVIGCFAAPEASADLLASYEPAETATLNVAPGGNDPGLTVTWPLQGGVGGVPHATDGTHLLRMQWTNEWDRKVEVRHDWTGSTFDLPGWQAGVAEIQVDVYIATTSAVPAVVGIWDDVFGWTGGCPLPIATDTWVTVSMNVGHLWHTGLDHIFALLFENLAGNSGTIYLDHLRLVPTREIRFAGYDWLVKSGNAMGPGPNDFSQSSENVWVDANGWLHLKVARRCDRWFCSEIAARDSFGHGTYQYTVHTRVDKLDVNEILGLFTWDGSADQYHYREVDFEFSQWGNPALDNAQYVIQPWDVPGNTHRFNIDYEGSTETTTHIMTWGSSSIDFTSYYGDRCSVPAPSDVIETWSYTGGFNPPPGGENIRINLWLMNGDPPVNGQDMEVIISDFAYSPDVPTDDDNDRMIDACDLCPDTIPGSPVDDEGCPPIIPGDLDRDGDVAGTDFAAFEACASGPAVFHAANCDNADLDADADVDQTDFGMFQRCLSGEDVPGDPDCAD